MLANYFQNGKFTESWHRFTGFCQWVIQTMKAGFLTTDMKDPYMRIVFLPGGYLNELGPFQPNQEIDVPAILANQLILDGLARFITPPSAIPVSVTLKVSEVSNV
jgi:hypothetical protein